MQVLMHLIVFEVGMASLLSGLNSRGLVRQVVILDGVAEVDSGLFLEIVFTCCVEILIQSPSEAPRFETVNHLEELDIIFVDLRELIMVDPPRIDREGFLIVP